jgi:hypothetical protein
VLAVVEEEVIAELPLLAAQAVAERVVLLMLQTQFLVRLTQEAVVAAAGVLLVRLRERLEQAALVLSLSKYLTT